METTFTVVIAIFATIGVYKIAEIINDRLVIFRDQAKLRRKRILAVDTLINNVRNHYKNIGILFNKSNKLESRVGIIEMLADNFERDMNKFNEVVMRDVNERFDKIAIMIDGRLDNISKRIYEMTISDTPYENRIKRLEEADKRCNDLHLTHAYIISDLQETQNQHKDRFKKVMDLKNIKVKG